MAGSQHALTLRSNGQRSRSHGCTVTIVESGPLLRPCAAAAAAAASVGLHVVRLLRFQVLLFVIFFPNRALSASFSVIFSLSR